MCKTYLRGTPVRKLMTSFVFAFVENKLFKKGIHFLSFRFYHRQNRDTEERLLSILRRTEKENYRTP